MCLCIPGMRKIVSVIYGLIKSEKQPSDVSSQKGGICYRDRCKQENNHCCVHSSTFSVRLHSDEILDSAPEHGIQRNGIKAQEPAM